MQDQIIELTNVVIDGKNRLAIASACKQFSNGLGAEYYAYNAFSPLLDNDISLHNTPDFWPSAQTPDTHLSVDPRFRHCQTSSSVIKWGELVYSDGDAGMVEKAFMREATDNGISDGITQPVHGPGSQVAMFSLYSTAPLPGYDESLLHSIWGFANAVHESVKRLNVLDEDSGSEYDVQLTQREKECLEWTANGKTSWEIALILDIAESTATFHIRNAIEKLGVRNRSHAIAKAIAQARIRLLL